MFQGACPSNSCLLLQWQLQAQNTRLGLSKHCWHHVCMSHAVFTLGCFPGLYCKGYFIEQCICIIIIWLVVGSVAAWKVEHFSTFWRINQHCISGVPHAKSMRSINGHMQCERGITVVHQLCAFFLSPTHTTGAAKTNDPIISDGLAHTGGALMCRPAKLHATVLFPSIGVREKRFFKAILYIPGSRRHLYINSTPLGFALFHLSDVIINHGWGETGHWGGEVPE